VADALSAPEQWGLAERPLLGRAAVVTGATGGLGAGFAEGLARAGAEVTLMARDAGRLDALRVRLLDAGHRVQSVACDITDVIATGRAIEQLERLDILVNNAGTNIPEPFLEVSPERYDEVTDLNVRGAFFCAQAGARRMVAARHGVIVNVTSQMGHVGGPQRSVYCATKHALEGLTKAMALELAPQGVRVCSLAPTYVHTPMTAPFLANANFRAETEARIPLGRVAEVDDVVGALVFLVSPSAHFVCGSSLLVDGGYTAQ
jgi:NAD(P)-dependent dehydrogenase (short-subunit alcohol dehydrogenase family)